MKQKGFTLIELLIVASIIAMLAVVAIPNYTQHLRESRRQEGINLLSEYKLMLENHFNQYGKYPKKKDVTLPTSNYYTFNYSTQPGQKTYTLTATAIGAQTDDTGCTSLTTKNSLDGIYPVNCQGN